MPLRSKRPPKLSGMAAILLVFQVDSRHEKITSVYVGLVVCRVNSHLYSPSQIPDFIKDIDGNLKAVCNTLKAGVTPARGAPIAFLWTISVVLCPSPQTLLIAWCIPPVMSKALNLIISTPATVPWGCACIVVYAMPPCSSVTTIPNNVLNMLEVGSSCPVGCSTTIGCIPLF